MGLLADIAGIEPDKGMSAQLRLFQSLGFMIGIVFVQVLRTGLRRRNNMRLYRALGLHTEWVTGVNMLAVPAIIKALAHYGIHMPLFRGSSQTIIILPKMLPDTCTAAMAVEKNNHAWPCQLDELVEWITLSPREFARLPSIWLVQSLLIGSSYLLVMSFICESFSHSDTREHIELCGKQQQHKDAVKRIEEASCLEDISRCKFHEAGQTCREGRLSECGEMETVRKDKIFKARRKDGMVV